MSKRGIRAEDLYELISVADPQLSPDGKRVLFVQTKIDKDKHEYRSNLYMLDLQGGIKRWTYGSSRDYSPRWSPDGQHIAFVSNRTGKPQIFVMPVDGGEAKQLTFCKNGANNPIWSPDGSKILFTVPLAPDDDLTEKEVKKDKTLEPYVVDRIRYKSDALGFLDGKRQHLAIVHLETGEVEQLTEGDADYTPGSWSPDGTSITFSANLTDNADYNLLSDIYILTIDRKEIQKITNSDGYFLQPSWSPDGKYIAYIGNKREYKSATLSKIWLYDVNQQTHICLTDGWDVEVGDAAIGDFQYGKVDPGIIWTEDSKGFYFIMSDQGNTGVYYGSIQGELYPAILDDQHVYGLTVNRKTHQAIAAISHPTHPGDLFFVDMTNGEQRQLTNVNEEFLKEVELSKAEPISWKAPDGWELHGWIMKPIGFEEGNKYPLVLEIHGGPHAMYANTYFHEFQMLAASGFVVLFTNPRGSHGYGQEFVNAVRGDYGGKDYLDIMSAVDYVLETFDFIDENRMGVTGGSYGGFMTNWIVGHTNRFKAAVTQRSISNWLSFYGVSDIGYFFSEWEVEGDLIDNAEKLWNHSPLKYVKNINTPLLILHGERDFRCPIEQAEQLYVALKRQKKPTKFVRFPEANHELSRSGNPKLRVDRLNYIKDWFEEHLAKS
jgi:dipeptidyl aminopeptidase/acylaminoacyl peptidase